MKPVEETEYLTEVLTREALDFIDRHHQEPFFLYLAHYTPHVPLQATAKYLDRYRHIEDQKTRIFAAMVSVARRQRRRGHRPDCASTASRRTR